MKIVLLGSSDMLYNMIEGVLGTKAQIAGVMNWKDIRKKTIKDYFHTDYTAKFIKKLNLPVIKAKSANSKEFRAKLLEISPDILLVGTWGEKIKKEIFDIPQIASINIHPSLLPKYRGANPYSRAIMFGETKTGLTFHLINEKFDAGAIILQKELPIYKTDNAQTLKTRLCKEVAPMCKELVNKLETEILMTIPQNEADASYYPHITQNEIVITPQNMSFDEIHNRIRGLAPWQSSYLLYRGEYFKIYEYNEVPNYIKRKNSNLCLKTKDNKFIYFKNLRALGRIKRFFTSTILNLLH